jgi:antitoxin component of MazEF toxin-antitoxin module
MDTSRKVTRSGNSLVISLPNAIRQRLGIKEGDSVKLHVDDVNSNVVITKDYGNHLISDDEMDDMNEFTAQFQPLMEKLKDM